MKRLIIYAFYDSDGYVDTYVFRMLEALGKCAEQILFVANGDLQERCYKELLRRHILVIKRENAGLDAGAYRAGMLHSGWKKLSEYDEVLLVNNSVMGPVYPLDEVFSKMDAKEVDFWGLTRHAEKFEKDVKNEYGYFPEHIQFYFIAFRNSFVKSYEFQFYWNNLPEMTEYWEVVHRHEVVFTKYFSDMGFTWDVYLHTEKMDYLSENLMILYPKLLLEKFRCPVFKRRVFYHNYGALLCFSVGQHALELYNYLEQECRYDMDTIWDNLLRTCNLSDLFENLHLDYILSGEFSHREMVRDVLKTKRTALIVHLYFLDLLDDVWKYVSHLPDLCDIYITVNSEEMKRVVEQKCRDFPCAYLEIRKIPNRGRDVASILVGVSDIVAQYEYLCFCHDKKSFQVSGSVGEGFNYKCFENTLYSEDYIYNVIETFEKNPRLGILCPPEPNHADYSVTLGFSWGWKNYQLTKDLADELGIRVPMDPDKDAVAPFGSFFWFRYDALKKFYEKDWKYEDFPEEPLPPDNTISHAIERLRPFVAQQAGYYTAYVMSDQYARIEYTNLRTGLKDFNRACFENGCLGSHRGCVEMVGNLIAKK